MTISDAISILMGITSLVALGAIPWAYCIGLKIARLETTIENGLSERVDRHSDSLDEIDNIMSENGMCRHKRIDKRA